MPLGPHVLWGERQWHRVEHMSRLGLVIAVGFGSFSLACSGGDAEANVPADPASTEPGAVLDETPEDAVPFDPEWGLAFSIKGRPAPMTARAELQVVEGQRPVHVHITGHTAGTDLLSLSLTFDGLENTLGVHQGQFGMPDSGTHIAVGSLDDQLYYSLGGTIEISVDRGGDIHGSFDVELARTELSATGEPMFDEADDEALDVDGQFSGAWVLNCQSHLAGHRTLSVGGEYCDNLQY
jgi:hypothetical protein